MMETYIRRLPSAPGLLESGRYLDTSVENGCGILACVGMSPSLILREVLRTAQAQNRLTYGPYAAGRLMSERNLCRVLACVLVDDGFDMDMNSVLIGAFCRENDIRIVKVSPLGGLAAILATGSDSEDDMSTNKDLKCIIIEHSKEGVPTTEDDLLMNYYQLQTRANQPLHINLPT